MTTPNEELEKVLVKCINEVLQGKPSDTVPEAMSAGLLLVTLMMAERVHPQWVLGALDLAKAHLLHGFHEVITQHRAQGGPG